MIFKTIIKCLFSVHQELGITSSVRIPVKWLRKWFNVQTENPSLRWYQYHLDTVPSLIIHTSTIKFSSAYQILHSSIVATVCRRIFSTMTLRLFWFYQQYCWPFVLSLPSGPNVGGLQRWRRRTPPSSFSVWGRSIPRRLPLRLCPRVRGRPLPGRVARACVPVRWGPWRPAAGRTGCPPATRVWGDNGGESPVPISRWRSGRRRG